MCRKAPPQRHPLVHREAIFRASAEAPSAPKTRANGCGARRGYRRRKTWSPVVSRSVINTVSQSSVTRAPTPSDHRMHVSRRRRDQRGSRSWPFIGYFLCSLTVASARVKTAWWCFLLKTEFLTSGPTVSCLRVKKYANEMALSYIPARAPARVAWEISIKVYII